MSIVNNVTNGCAVLWGINKASQNATCQSYIGSICLPFLTPWQECLLQEYGDNQLNVNNGVASQNMLEQEVDELQKLLGIGKTC